LILPNLSGAFQSWTCGINGKLLPRVFEFPSSDLLLLQSLPICKYENGLKLESGEEFSDPVNGSHELTLS